MSDPTACAFCEGPFKSSDWSPFCSAGCEFGASLAIERAKGAAAERARIVAHLRAQAEAGGDPWMSHVAYEVEAGVHHVASEQG